MSNDDSLIAQIGRTIGLWGDLKFHLHTDFPEQFKVGNTYKSSRGDLTIADINYNLSPNNSYENGDTTSDAQFFNAFITYPIVLNEKSTILAGIRGNIWKVAYSPELIWPETYYSAGLTLGYNHKFNDKQSFLFILLPRLNSDFRTIDGEAFQLAAAKLPVKTAFTARYTLYYRSNQSWSIYHLTSTLGKI